MKIQHREGDFNGTYTYFVELTVVGAGLLSYCTAMLDFAQAIVDKRTSFIFPKAE